VTTEVPIAGQSEPAGLSPAMREALSMVSVDWQLAREYFHLESRNDLVRHPLFDRTFKALVSRKLIEWRERAGAWEWRRVPPAGGETPKTTNHDGKRR